jgi:hypothetical protein
MFIDWFLLSFGEEFEEEFLNKKSRKKMKRGR